MQKDCPSKRAYIAIDDGIYISTSNALQDIDEGAPTNDGQGDDGPSLGTDYAMDYRSIIVQRVLDAQMEEAAIPNIVSKFLCHL